MNINQVKVKSYEQNINNTISNNQNQKVYYFYHPIIF